MLIELVLTPFSARPAHRFGARTMIVSDLVSVAVGLTVAVFGALLVQAPMRASLWSAAAIAPVTAAMTLRPQSVSAQEPLSTG